MKNWSPWSWVTVTMMMTIAGGCVEEPQPELESRTSDLNSAERRRRSEGIKRAAANAGLSNAVLLAGIANAETGLAHCWREATWACQGPASSSCGGGPVIAGAGDGPCRYREGGLGMFQFDAGTHNQTLNRYGHSVLSVEGNTAHAVDFVTDMVIRSRYISGVSNRAEALRWLDGVKVGGDRWHPWIQTVTHYYNGCVPGRCSVYWSRYDSYDAKARSVYNELGASFWDAATAPSTPPQDLTTPGGLAPRDGRVANGGFVTLAWGAVGGARTYDVHMSYQKGDGSWTDYHTWTGRNDTQFNVWPQNDDLLYRWRVRACVTHGCSNWSDYERFTVGDASPDDTDTDRQPEDDGQLRAPGSVSPAGGTFSQSSVDMTWSSVGAATSYELNLMVFSNGSWSDYHTWTGIGEARFTVWPQVNNTSYRWQVRACNAQLCSPYTSFESFYFTGR